MKILVSGSREMPENQKSRNMILAQIMECLVGKDDLYPQDVTIITGGAKGADTVAHDLAVDYGMKTIVHYAEWNRFGKSAGPIRNGRMLDEEPDVVIAFPIGKSVGTRHCIKEAERRGIRTITIPVSV